MRAGQAASEIPGLPGCLESRAPATSRGRHTPHKPAQVALPQVGRISTLGPSSQSQSWAGSPQDPPALAAPANCSLGPPAPAGSEGSGPTLTLQKGVQQGLQRARCLPPCGGGARRYPPPPALGPPPEQLRCLLWVCEAVRGHLSP